MQTFFNRYTALWNNAAGALPAINVAAPPPQLIGPPGQWWLQHVLPAHADLPDPARLIPTEYIYCYFLELGRMFDTLDVVCRRFAPTSEPPPPELARFDVSPLHTVGELLWGYKEDKDHRTTAAVRRPEYQRQYGLQVEVPAATSRAHLFESRSQFLQYFHRLLHACARFYRESDDNTINANAFPVLSALRPLHMLLAESAHNQYQFITTKVRLELWVVQQILSLAEVQRFLGAPLNVPYPAPWMGAVDSIRRIMRWGDTSITEFYNLAQLSEVTLLTVRYGPFRPNFNEANVAGAWALHLRNTIEQYIYSYQAVTGVDLAADSHLAGGRIDTTPPSVYLNARQENARLRLRHV